MTPNVLWFLKHLLFPFDVLKFYMCIFYIYLMVGGNSLELILLTSSDITFCPIFTVF